MTPAIEGLIVALPTPFTDDGRIDAKAVVKHLEYLTRHGVTRLLVCGTTGEFFSLSPVERRRVLKLTRTHFPGALYFQAGGDSLGLTRQQCAWAHELGADAIFCLPPYYVANAPEEGIIDYFNTVATSVSIPFILYNFPHNTQNPLTAEMLQQIKHDGIKDSASDLGLIKATPRYLVGSDTKIIHAFDAGGIGFVSARANVAPALYVAMDAAWRARNRDQMIDLHESISETARVFSDPGQIAKIKYVLAATLPGYPANVRLPLIALSREDVAPLDKFAGDC
jgi:4-hydroxy-tetrahydrodipicolinate synthase